MKTKRKELAEIDIRVLAIIRAGQQVTFRGIETASRLSMRVVDRSLQRLRKQKFIRFNGPMRVWEWIPLSDKGERELDRELRAEKRKGAA